MNYVPTGRAVPLLEAGIYDQLGDYKTALEKYQLAIHMGERNPEAVRRTLASLYQQHESGKAKELLDLCSKRNMGNAGGCQAHRGANRY